VEVKSFCGKHENVEEEKNTYIERQRLLRSSCHTIIDDVTETCEENAVLFRNATTHITETGNGNKILRNSPHIHALVPVTAYRGR